MDSWLLYFYVYIADIECLFEYKLTKICKVSNNEDIYVAFKAER